MNALALQAVVLLSGFAALSWEILWQQQISLAVGVSAQAAAITLSAMMLGMALGAGFAHRAMRRLSWSHPGGYLALLEVAIGLFGLALPRAFALLESADTVIYQAAPALAPAAQVVGIFLALLPPSLAMGATMPALARLTAGTGTTMARLYAVNLAGAALGVVGSTFLVVPTLGVGIATGVIAFLNVSAGLLFFVLRPPPPDVQPPISRVSATRPGHALPRMMAAAFCTGCSAFALEVIWFRSLRAALQATTESFALMLCAVLAALAAGGFLAPRLKRLPWVTLPGVMFTAGCLVIAVVPVVERFDLFVPLSGGYATFLLKRLLIVIAVLGLPMTVLGLGLPWLLDEQQDARKVGELYAVNTLGALAGSLGAAWILLPRLGVTRGAWVAGCLLFLAAAVLRGGIRPLLQAGGLAAAGLVFVTTTASGVGRLRVQSPVLRSQGQIVLASREGPDVTVSAVADAQGVRHLVVDGFFASGEGSGAHYMSWMGRLPMLLHPDPREALVICFGTGQTVNAVREENPERVDVVDVNPAVFEIAAAFPKNRGVLDDPRCRHLVMDGRAWLRRTTQQYDVITLEPMPPTFAGSNSLYSLEFYQLLRARLREGGVTTQWLPFHLVDPAEGAAIVATFHRVFQDVDVSVDSQDQTTILVGYKRSDREPRPSLAGERSQGRGRLSPEDSDLIQQSLIGVGAVSRFADTGAVITDDNQLLSYGYGRMKWWGRGSPNERQNFGVSLLRNAAVVR